MNKNQIINDENFLCGLSLKDKNIEVLLVYIGFENVQYYFFWNNELIFSGNDYKPSPLYDQDSLDSLISLLGFLTLKKGDTDSEYFKDYTKKQFEWSESIENEDLRTLVSDFEYLESEYHKQAKKYFKKAYYTA